MVTLSNPFHCRFSHPEFPIMRFNPEAWLMQRTVLGGLNTVLVKPSKSDPSILVVLCHGYGAPGTDLVPLYEEILDQLPEESEKPAFLFPEAPFDLSEQGMPHARAWWPLNMAKLMQMSAMNSFDEMRDVVPEGLLEARQALSQCVAECFDQQKWPETKVVLGGFSQGAMLAIDTAIRGSIDRIVGLLVYSGALICESQWLDCISKKPLELPLIQSHGTQDQVLPIATGRWLSQLLAQAGCHGSLDEFTGPHTIPAIALKKTAELLSKLS